MEVLKLSGGERLLNKKPPNFLETRILLNTLIVKNLCKLFLGNLLLIH